MGYKLVFEWWKGVVLRILVNMKSKVLEKEAFRQNFTYII